MNMISSLEIITPELAKVYLSKMIATQRPIRKSWVAQLADYIIKGHFHPTHQGIAFDIDGFLIDGQHRLMAIIEAGMDVIMYVTRGVSPGTWHAIDLGVKRNLSDSTGMNKRDSEVFRLVSLHLYNQHQPSYEVILKIAESNLGKIISRLHKFAGTSRKTVTAVPMRLMAALNAHILHPENTGDIESSYPFVQYRSLSVMDYETMSESVQAFCRQATTIRHDTLDLMCRGYVALNQKNKSLSRIQISDRAGTLAEIRYMLKKSQTPQS